MYEMAGLHFYLERRNTGNEDSFTRGCPLILSFSYSSYRVKVYTGRKIAVQEWDRESERVKTIYAKSVEFNTYLGLLESRVRDYYREYESSGITPDEKLFKAELKKMVKSEVPDFFRLLLRFIEENSRIWSLSTYKKMRTFYNQLRDFSLSEKEILNAGKVNQDFADRLVEFYRSRKLRNTSIKKNLDLLRWFMNWCLNKELVFNRDFEKIRFSPGKNTSEISDVFLSWDELKMIYNCSLLSKKEEWCRDIFCFIAFTGIRFSETGKLFKSSLADARIQLGGDPGIKIRLSRFALEICKKYENKYYRNNSLFPQVSLMTFHKHLRKAAQKSGLNRLVYKESFEQSADSLYDLVSAKIAINTFYAHGFKLDNAAGILSMGKALNAKSRILSRPGILKLAEEKQLNTSEKLYESFRNTGTGS